MKKRFGRKHRQKEDMVLQITSLADILVILLVFLLKSFSTGISTITPSNNLMLPEVKVSEKGPEALKLEVSADSILIDEKPVTALNAFTFEPNDLESNGTPRSLNAALIKQRQKDTLQKYPRLMVLADQNTPYSTLKTILASAASSGFADFKLVVVEDQ